MFKKNTYKICLFTLLFLSALGEPLVVHAHAPAVTEEERPPETTTESWWATTEEPYLYPEIGGDTEISEIPSNEGASEYAVYGDFFTYLKETYLPIPYFEVTFWEAGLYTVYATIVFFIITGVIHGIAGY